MNKLVSIVVPVFNTEKYIKKCIESLENQTYKDIEIIIINDASPDSSDSVIKELQAKYSNIKYIKLEKNLGVSSARNIGIENSTGKWLIFLDSDDTFYSNAIERLVENKKNTEELVIGNFSRQIGENIVKQDFLIKAGVYEVTKIANEVISNIPLNWLSCIGNKLYDLDIIKNNNLYFNGLEYKYNEDLAFIIDYLNVVNNIRIIEENIYCYLKRRGSSQHSYRKDSIKTITNARKKIRIFLEKFEVFEEKKEEYAKSMLEIYLGILLNDWKNKKEFYELCLYITTDFEYINYVKDYKKIGEKYISILAFLLRKNKFYYLYIYILILKIVQKIRSFYK